MTWPEFDSHIKGLFRTDSRLSRHFFPPKSDPDDQADEEG